MPKIVTQAEFARKIGLGNDGNARKRVVELIDMGVIKKRKDGRLDYAPALASATAYLQAREKSEGEQENKQALTNKRLRLICQRLQFDLDVEKGKYVLQSEVERDVEAMCARAKAVLLRLPQSIGNLLGVDAQKKSDVLVVEALKELEDNPLGR